MTYRPLLLLALFASPSMAETTDNCASLLGSIAVEHRYARAQLASAHTKFICPEDTSALIGASKQRIRSALGPPDESANGTDPTAATEWSYLFTGTLGDEREGSYPVLSFSFNQLQEVSAVSCELVR
jgi:hypothetical protein